MIKADGVIVLMSRIFTFWCVDSIIATSNNKHDYCPRLSSSVMSSLSSNS